MVVDWGGVLSSKKGFCCLIHVHVYLLKILFKTNLNIFGLYYSLYIYIYIYTLKNSNASCVCIDQNTGLRIDCSHSIHDYTRKTLTYTNKTSE
jgi:hypothetical protein